MRTFKTLSFAISLIIVCFLTTNLAFTQDLDDNALEYSTSADKQRVAKSHKSKQKVGYERRHKNNWEWGVHFGLGTQVVPGVIDDFLTASEKKLAASSSDEAQNILSDALSIHFLIGASASYRIQQSIGIGLDLDLGYGLALNLNSHAFLLHLPVMFRLYKHWGTTALSLGFGMGPRFRAGAYGENKAEELNIRYHAFSPLSPKIVLGLQFPLTKQLLSTIEFALTISALGFLKIDENSMQPCHDDNMMQNCSAHHKNSHYRMEFGKWYGDLSLRYILVF
ncbi:MAG: hypothetical protein WC966_04250 [Bradymonadales bacterium]|jgi:hypothetical protein